MKRREATARSAKLDASGASRLGLFSADPAFLRLLDEHAAILRAGIAVLERDVGLCGARGLPHFAGGAALGPQYSALAAIWVVVAGTLWWYVLSRAAEALLKKFARRQKTSFRLVRRTKATRRQVPRWTAILVLISHCHRYRSDMGCAAGQISHFVAGKPGGKWKAYSKLLRWFLLYRLSCRSSESFAMFCRI